MKTVTSLFSKTITCYPKGRSRGAERRSASPRRRISLALRSLVRRCASSDFNAEDIQYFSGAIPGTSIVIGDEGRNEDAEDQGLRRICPFTDANGRAAVEIFNSNPTRLTCRRCSWTRGSSGT